MHKFLKMRKLSCLILVFAVTTLTACGPKRHGCGARGICKTENLINKPESQNKQNPVS